MQCKQLILDIEDFSPVLLKLEELAIALEGEEDELFAPAILTDGRAHASIVNLWRAVREAESTGLRGVFSPRGFEYAALTVVTVDSVDVDNLGQFARALGAALHSSNRYFDLKDLVRETEDALYRATDAKPPSLVFECARVHGVLTQTMTEQSIAIIDLLESTEGDVHLTPSNHRLYTTVAGRIQSMWNQDNPLQIFSTGIPKFVDPALQDPGRGLGMGFGSF